MMFVFQNYLKPKMKSSITFFVIISIVLFQFTFISIALATTYYIDFKSGSDANQGRSTSLPFKHCPGDSNATGNASSTLLSPGDIVIFKGGVSYLGLINVNYSGTGDDTNQRIIYDGDSGTYVTRWGSGSAKAIIDGNQTYHQGFLGTNKSYVTLNNFEVTNQLQLPSGSQDWTTAGIRFVSSNYIYITNCYIHNVGCWNNDCDDGSDSDGNLNNSCEGGGIAFLNSIYSKITNCEVTKTGKTGISLNSSSHCTIDGCYIHDHIIWGIDIAAESASSDYTTIKDTKVYNIYMMGSPYYSGPDTDAPHTDGIFFRSTYPFTYRDFSNSLVDSCAFNNLANIIIGGGTADIFFSYADGVVIRNCTFVNPNAYHCIQVSWGSHGQKILNNTFYAPTASALLLNPEDNDGNYIVANNLIIGGGGSLYTNYAVGSTFSNNYYFNDPSSILWHDLTSGKFYNWSQWQALGVESNAYHDSSTSNALLTDISGYPVFDVCLKPMVNSPVIGKGMNLSSIWPGAVDKVGTARLSSGAWSIGAYESSGSQLPPSPKNFRSIPISQRFLGE